MPKRKTDDKENGREIYMRQKATLRWCKVFTKEISGCSWSHNN
ncbi:hypothetical protein MtrunA17_Chr7g0244201 [Medicago truncatula]|uniref:Uncharacterized protein n=1 Tax=Medicago truncatula TaxID=3880 RepID=A0A396GZS8_MEDTR|nr:hypothetical protein MtrunA17_Chr7g0244201 [Medicago truncatula]